MDINKILTLANEALKSAQVTLIQQHVFMPVIIFLNDENKLDWISFNPQEENFDDKLKNFLENKSKTSEFLIQIIDSYYKESSLNTISDSLFENPDADSALAAFVYTKKYTYLKILSYLLNNDKYTFMENDWEDITNTRGIFKNPY